MGAPERLSWSTVERDADLEDDFPGLRDGAYAITSPKDPTYHCVSWAVGDTKNFWDDIGVKGYYWPPGVPSADSLAGWVAVFRLHGYAETDDDGFEPQDEKIAIYASANGVPQHVARQKSSGLWSSKMGKGNDIEHELRVIEGELYGEAVVIMRRPCAGKRVFE